MQAFLIIVRYFLMNSLSKRVNSSSIRRSSDAPLSSTSRLKALARAMRASSFLISKETPGKSSYERSREKGADETVNEMRTVINNSDSSNIGGQYIAVYVMNCLPSILLSPSHPTLRQILYPTERNRNALQGNVLHLFISLEAYPLSNDFFSTLSDISYTQR